MVRFFSITIGLEAFATSEIMELLPLRPTPFSHNFVKLVDLFLDSVHMILVVVLFTFRMPNGLRDEFVNESCLFFRNTKKQAITVCFQTQLDVGSDVLYETVHEACQMLQFKDAISISVLEYANATEFQAAVEHLNAELQSR